jgi:predicted amidohydrolase
MSEDLTLDLWTHDVGAEAESIGAYAAAMVDRIEESWASGADMVLLPEFSWMGLEHLLKRDGREASLRGVAKVVWDELLPAISTRMKRPGKMAVLGTAPCVEESTGGIRNRAIIFADGKLCVQDKLHLTPWEKEFAPGAKLSVFEFRGIRVAVIICLDIEIPELAARLRDFRIDLILCPSATETILGVERVDRCASARAVELGCYVGVTHLVGRTQSELIDENIGRLALYRPSQAAFRREERWTETEVFENGFHRLRTVVSPRALEVTRRMRAETNPSLLGKDCAGIGRDILIEFA